MWLRLWSIDSNSSYDNLLSRKILSDRGVIFDRLDFYAQFISPKLGRVQDGRANTESIHSQSHSVS